MVGGTMKNKKYIKINAIQCLECGDIIYSRTRHDYRRCSCGACAIDGGFEYTRVVANKLKCVKRMKIKLETVHQELFDDWNEHINEFGLIKTKNWISPPLKKTCKEKIMYLVKQVLSLGKF